MNFIKQIQEGCGYRAVKISQS